MAYTEKYRLQFIDLHVSTPVRWRIDILDDQPVDFIQPYNLTPSDEPLIFRRTNANDNKNIFILGLEATIQYEFTNQSGDPKPELFFGADERRYQVRVYKNDIINYIGYIRPDGCSYQFKYEPFTVTLNAVEGFAFADATNLNVFDNTGLLQYEKYTIFDLLMTRGLYQIFDDTIPLNVINTLYPENMANMPLLLGANIHNDIYYDFVNGPKSIWYVMESLCQIFDSRIYYANNSIWFIRTQDLFQDDIIIGQYLPSEFNVVNIPGFIGDIGPVVGQHRAIPIEGPAEIIMQPALKKASFEVEYKSINNILNFFWAQWDGVNFSNWTKVNNPIISQVPDPTLNTGYNLFFDANSPYFPDESFIYQFFDVEIGDILEIELKAKFYNCKQININIELFGRTSGLRYWQLQANGSIWAVGPFQFSNGIGISRSGNKQDALLSIKSIPVPSIPVGQPDTQLKVRVVIGGIPEIISLDDSPIEGVYISPIKVGAITISSIGRHIDVQNNDRFSKIQEKKNFDFIDTGEKGLSNTIFVNNGIDINEPAANWLSTKPNIFPGDIERHMARSAIDQYAKSIYTWEGNLYSNSIEFYNIFVMKYSNDAVSLAGKLFMQLNDTYTVKNCTHDILLAEILPEDGANIIYSETDLEEINN